MWRRFRFEGRFQPAIAAMLLVYLIGTVGAIAWAASAEAKYRGRDGLSCSGEVA